MNNTSDNVTTLKAVRRTMIIISLFVLLIIGIILLLTQDGWGARFWGVMITALPVAIAVVHYFISVKWVHR